KGAREGQARTDPQVTRHEVENILLPPFKAAIKEAHILGVMSSYNDYDSVPVTGSHYWLTERLRNEFGFRGYVVSDSAAVEYLYNKHGVAADMKDAVRQSVAGILPNANEDGLRRYRDRPNQITGITVVQGNRNKLGDRVKVNYAKGCDVTSEHWPQIEVLPEPLNEKEKDEIAKAVDAAKK